MVCFSRGVGVFTGSHQRHVRAAVWSWTSAIGLPLLAYDGEAVTPEPSFRRRIDGEGIRKLEACYGSARAP